MTGQSSPGDPLPSDPGPDDELARLDTVFRVEGPRLLRFFRRRVENSENARDLLQEVFARLLGSPTGRSLERPGPYLQRIARNLLIDGARSQEARLAPFHVAFDEALAGHVTPDQEERIHAEDLLRQYECALQTLPERTREIFEMHRVEGLTYTAIRDRLGVSIGTVEYHIGRALAHIDRELEASR